MFSFKSIIFVKIQFHLTQESKRLISFSGFSLSFSIFSVETEDVFSPAHQVNQIFCYICFVITYSPARIQAIKHRGHQKWVSGPLECPCATSNNVGWFSVQYLVSFFTLLYCHQQMAHKYPQRSVGVSDLDVCPIGLLLY